MSQDLLKKAKELSEYARPLWEVHGAINEGIKLIPELIACIEKLEAQNLEVLEVCKGHTNFMWAAKIVSIFTGCDFRDSQNELNTLLEDKNKS